MIHIGCMHEKEKFTVTFSGYKCDQLCGKENIPVGSVMYCCYDCCHNVCIDCMKGCDNKEHFDNRVVETKHGFGILIGLNPKDNQAEVDLFHYGNEYLKLFVKKMFSFRKILWLTRLSFFHGFVYFFIFRYCEWDF